MTESKHFLLGVLATLLCAGLFFIAWPARKAQEPIVHSWYGQSRPGAEHDAFERGKLEGVEFAINAMTRSNVFLSPLTLPSGSSISNCIFVKIVQFKWHDESPFIHLPESAHDISVTSCQFTSGRMFEDARDSSIQIRLPPQSNVSTSEITPIAEVVIERLDKGSFVFHIASEQGISYVESFKKYFTPVTALSFSKYDPLKPPAVIRLDVMANYDPDLLFQELANASFVKAK